MSAIAIMIFIVVMVVFFLTPIIAMATQNDKTPSEFKTNPLRNDNHTDGALPVAGLTIATKLLAQYNVQWDATDKTRLTLGTNQSLQHAGVLHKDQETRVNQTLDEVNKLAYTKVGEAFVFGIAPILKGDLLVSGANGRSRRYSAATDTFNMIIQKAMCDITVTGDLVRVWELNGSGVVYA